VKTETVIIQIPPPHPGLPENFCALDVPEQCKAVADLLGCDVHEASAFLQMSLVADEIGDLVAYVSGHMRHSVPPWSMHRSAILGTGLALVELGLMPSPPMGMERTPAFGPAAHRERTAIGLCSGPSEVLRAKALRWIAEGKECFFVDALHPVALEERLRTFKNWFPESGAALVDVEITVVREPPEKGAP